jgi:PAS domain S-box-containing protein
MPASTPYLVLCVDDEASGLKLRKLILERKGYLVSTARTAPEALAAFRSGDFDIVVTDHLLGRETATAMSVEMKRFKPNVPIIVFSGTTDMPEGIGVADAFISKAEGPETLLARVEELAARSRKRRASSVADLPLQEKLLSAHSESAQLLAALVDSSDDAIISLTLDGTILSWNKGAERMYGYRSDETMGKEASLLLPPDRASELRDYLERLTRGEKLDHFETVRKAKDGHLLTVSLTVSPIRDAEDRVIGASTIARDVTQSKLAEQSLRNSEKLAVAGRMAATVAHEINNPLEAVSNALYLLAESPSLDESARQVLEIARDELAKIRQIATLTLGLHRGDADRPKSVRVCELIDNVLSLYERKFRSLGIAVETRYETDLAVTAFAGELRQVFSNLIVNAADALEKSGDKLSVHVFESVDWASPAQRGLRITISDNGSGIPADKKRHIFEPFYTTKGSKGTGIGLWVCLGIVQKYGGKIRFRSIGKAGRSGTTFCVFLPADTGPQVITSIAS